MRDAALTFALVAIATSCLIKADDFPRADREHLQLGLEPISMVKTYPLAVAAEKKHQLHLAPVPMQVAAENLRVPADASVPPRFLLTWKDFVHIPLGILEAIYSVLIGCP